MNATELLERALALHQQNQLSQAEAIYRQVLSADPRNVDALHLLGLLLHQSGRSAEAEPLLRSAIAAEPDVPQLHNVLGLILTAVGNRDEGIESFRRAIAIDPAFPDPLLNLSGALQAAGQINEAIDALEQATKAAPSANTWYQLAQLLYRERRSEQSMQAVRRSLELDPNHLDAGMLLGALLINQRDYMAAGQALFEVARHRPNDPAVQYHLGLAYDRLGDADAAAHCYLRAIAQKPDYPEAHNNLGVIRHHQRRMREAVEHHKAALAAKPTHATAWANLGWDYWAMGLVSDAIAHYRKALELDPDDYQTHSNLLMALHYLPQYTPQQIFQEHVLWGERHASRFYPTRALNRTSRQPNSRLRIGYVSSNFRQHAVSIFFEPVMAHHDHAQFEIVCYSDLAIADHVTERIRKCSDQWHDVHLLTDEQLDALIRSHEIDILVDLNGHIANNRLLVFARKPAPVQVTYLGYPDTTGLKTMDYRLTDAWQDPPGPQTDSLAVEKLVRLPNTAWTYDSWSELSVGDPPVLTNGFVTFGSLNNLAKVTIEAIARWSQILKAVPHSRMSLLVQTDRFAEIYLTEKFAAHGIGKDRLIFHTQRSHEDYLKLFSTLDVALDTYPYNGHTTTLNATWMGIPVVTLAGTNHVARAGLGVLSTIGATELIVHTEEEYVALAVALASDQDRLVRLRRSLRNMMKTSPLLDSATFTQNLETEYRRMWSQWSGGD